jgi:hypothetical protein
LAKRRPLPGPPRSRELRDRLETYLANNRDRTVARREIRVQAEAFLGHAVSRQAVKNWFDFWTRTGFLVGGRAREDLPEQLYLLLLDVPANAAVRERVHEVLAGRTRGDPEPIAGIFNVLARVPGRSIASVQELAATCIARGALDARALVTLAGSQRTQSTAP